MDRCLNATGAQLFRLTRAVYDATEGLGTMRFLARSSDMKNKAQKPDREHQDDDDLWTWIVIGLIFVTVTLALYLPLIWTSFHA